MTAPHTGARRRRATRAWMWLGLTLVATGLVLLGCLAWQFWGTNWVADSNRSEVLHDVRSAWSVGEEPAGGVRTRFGRATAIVEIPVLGDDYAVPVLEGTGSDVLAVGYGHFTGTARPGEIGNYVVAAHRVTHGEPLRRMPELRAGDVVRVVTRERTYVYRLTTGGPDLVVPMTATWVTTPLPHHPDGGVEPAQHAGQRLLTLTTCAELFHTDDRMIAFGRLVRSFPTAGAGSGAEANRG